ncbi:zinc finger protein with KRAB and SCAN domains 1-like [Argonauta hians]
MMQTDDPYMFMRGNESFSPSVFPDPKSTTSVSTPSSNPSTAGIAPLDKKPFKCSHCSKAFLYSSSLTAHEMMMHRSDLPYECRDCGRRFSLNTHLERHQMIHTGERSYQCEECGKTFLHQRYVNAHVRRIHNLSRPFKCEYCTKAFAHNCHLTEHIAMHSREKT